MVGVNVGEDQATVTGWMAANMAGNMTYPVALDVDQSLKAAYPTPGIRKALYLCWLGDFFFCGREII